MNRRTVLRIVFLFFFILTAGGALLIGEEQKLGSSVAAKGPDSSVSGPKQSAADPGSLPKEKNSVSPSKIVSAENKKTSSVKTQSGAMNFIDEVKKANDRFNEKNFSACLKILKDLYGKSPEVAPPYIYFAQWLAKDKTESERFFNSLEMAAFEYPDDPEAYVLLGEISLQQKQYAAADLLLKKGSVLIEKYKESYRKRTLQNLLLQSQIRLAEFRMDTKEMSARIDDLLKLNPNSAEIHRQKGTLLFQMNKDAEAQKLFEKADELEKDSVKKGIPAVGAMAQLYLVRGDFKKAADYIDKAIANHSKSKEVLALAVVHRIRNNKIEEAAQFAQRLLEVDPSSPETKKLAAQLALFSEDFSKAEKLFQDLVLLSPVDSGAVNGLALALCEQKDRNKIDRALEYAKENARRSGNENNPEYLGTLAWVLFKQKKYAEANEALAQAISGKAFNITNMYYLANIAVFSNKKEDAIQILETILKKETPFPKRAEAGRLLGELKSQKK